MNVLVQLLQGLNVVGVLAPLAISTALKIKALFTSLGPDFQVNITNLAGEAVTADDATILEIAQWKLAQKPPFALLPEEQAMIDAQPPATPPDVSA